MFTIKERFTKKIKREKYYPNLKYNDNKPNNDTLIYFNEDNIFIKSETNAFFKEITSKL